MYNIFTEGHALSKKLINQVKKTDKKIKQLQLEYNSFREQLSDEGKTSFHELTFDRAKQQGTFIYLLSLFICFTSYTQPPKRVIFKLSFDKCIGAVTIQYRNLRHQTMPAKLCSC